MKIIKLAYTTVPFYMDLLSDYEKDLDDILEKGIEGIPFIDKNHVIEKGANIISAKYIPKYLNNKLMYLKTSGSTGKYMDIFWDKDDFVKSMIPLWIMRKKYYGIAPTDKMCSFYTMQDTSIEDERDEYQEKYSLIFSKVNLSAPRLVEIYKKMCEFRPKWLILQPSIAVLLCQCIKKYSLVGLDSVEYVEFNGEILTDEVRKLTKETFKCSVANQYGANEFNSIAYECPYGNMHVMDSNVYVEVTDKEGKNVIDESGDICITSLTNNAMPLIRYKIEDIGIISNKKCDCGSCSQIISLMSGRKNDYVLCEDGTEITSYVFVRAIDSVNMMLDGVIKQFNIIQYDINKFKVKFVVEDITDNDELEYLFKKFVVEDRLIDASYDFEYYESLFPDNNTGKHKYFKRKIN